MSLPETARWEYDFQVEEGSPEADFIDACKHSRDWRSSFSIPSAIMRVTHFETYTAKQKLSQMRTLFDQVHEA
eukprot:9031364-Ditylum_brightwellii.AAC.1